MNDIVIDQAIDRARDAYHANESTLPLDTVAELNDLGLNVQNIENFLEQEDQ